MSTTTIDHSHAARERIEIVLVQGRWRASTTVTVNGLAQAGRYLSLRLREVFHDDTAEGRRIIAAELRAMRAAYREVGAFLLTDNPHWRLSVRRA